MRALLLGLGLGLGLSGVALGCGSQRVDRADDGRRDALACVEARAAEGSDAARVAELCSRRAFSFNSERYRGGYLEAIACVRESGGAPGEAASACRAES